MAMPYVDGAWAGAAAVGPATFADSARGDEQSHTISASLTTLKIDNLPSTWSQDFLLELWPPEANCINYVYVPFNMRQRRTTHYAFLNFTSCRSAERFRLAWHEHQFGVSSTGRELVLKVSAAPVQGVEESIRHLKARNIEGVLNDKYFPAVFDPHFRRLIFRDLVAALPPSPAQGAQPRTTSADEGVREARQSKRRVP